MFVGVVQHAQTPVCRLQLLLCGLKQTNENKKHWENVHQENETSAFLKLTEYPLFFRKRAIQYSIHEWAKLTEMQHLSLSFTSTQWSRQMQNKWFTIKTTAKRDHPLVFKKRLWAVSHYSSSPACFFFSICCCCQKLDLTVWIESGSDKPTAPFFKVCAIHHNQQNKPL